MNTDETKRDAEPTPASDGSVAGERPLFSERFKMAHAAFEWCAENGASLSAPVNIVTALFSLGLVVQKPKLTDAEREAVSECYEWATVADHRSLAATLRGLLERLG